VISTFSGFIRGFVRSNPSSFLLLLSESKDLTTYRGGTNQKDQLAAMSRALIPDASSIQRASHTSGKSKLDTLLNRFNVTMLHRIRQVRSNELRRNIAVKDLKEDLRRLYHQAYILGLRGSSAALSADQDLLSIEDRRWVDSAVNHEMRYLNRFLDQAFNNELTPSQIQARTQMYMNTIKSVYDSGRVIGSSASSLIYWVYNPEAHHCNSCLYLRDNSPYTKRTLPTTPRSGSTECLSNCKCHLRIVHSDPSLVAQVEAKSMTRASMLTYLRQMKTRRASNWHARHGRTVGERLEAEVLPSR